MSIKISFKGPKPDVVYEGLSDWKVNLETGFVDILKDGKIVANVATGEILEIKEA